MIWLLAALGALLVVAVGLLAVGGAVRRTEVDLRPVVFEVHDAVDWIAERLPEEAASRLTPGDVVRVVGWWLEFVGDAGLASRHGQELGGSDAVADGATAEQDAAVDHVVARALEVPDDEGGPLDAVAVVVVLDLLVVYLTELGAIGAEAQAGGEVGA